MTDTLPGEDLVSQGLADLRAGRRSVPGLLVASASGRLRALGFEVPELEGCRPAHELYDLLAAEDADSAHARYNALRRRLVSHVRAADHAAAR